MDLFKNLLQPTIVYFGEASNKTYPVKNTYMLNYNVMQIDWFKNNSIVLEGGYGILLLEQSDETNPYSSSAYDVKDLTDDGIINREDEEIVLDVPRIFFRINSKFYENNEFKTPNVINSFIISLLQLGNSEDIAPFIANGNYYDGKGLLPNEDYFINYTFANFLKEYILGVEDEKLIIDEEIQELVDKINAITLPNYLTTDAQIQVPWSELPKEEQNTTDIEYFYDRNTYNHDLTIENDINDFYKLFCSTILNYSNIEIDSTDLKNLRYRLALEYFANGKSDAVSQGLSLMLGNTVTAESYVTTCQYHGSDDSCVSVYNKAMEQYLIDMLGDAEFYYDWLYNYNEDGSKSPDILGFKKLIYLINALLTSPVDLSLGGNTLFKCGLTNYANNKNTSNFDIISKYKNVLEYGRECKLNSNINKIKVFGNQFGELLPKLQF